MCDFNRLLRFIQIVLAVGMGLQSWPAVISLDKKQSRENQGFSLRGRGLLRRSLVNGLR